MKHILFKHDLKRTFCCIKRQTQPLNNPIFIRPKLVMNENYCDLGGQVQFLQVNCNCCREDSQQKVLTESLIWASRSLTSKAGPCLLITSCREGDGGSSLGLLEGSRRKSFLTRVPLGHSCQSSLLPDCTRHSHRP